MNQKFELNGKTYTTDKATIKTLQSIMDAAKTSGDSSAVMAVLFLGLKTGRITEINIVNPIISRIYNRETGPVYVKPGIYVKVFTRDCSEFDTVYNSQLHPDQAKLFNQVMDSLKRLYAVREVIHNGTIQVWYAAINTRGAYTSAYRAQRFLQKQISLHDPDAAKKYYSIIVHYPPYVRNCAAISFNLRPTEEGK